MRALYIIVPILCILVIAYRYYSAFIAAKILVLDDSRPTPAHTRYDGHNFYPTTRWVLFGHHFAAITGAGPLVGPVLAAQFGYAPGTGWPRSVSTWLSIHGPGSPLRVPRGCLPAGSTRRRIGPR
jgi:carbon starvation protein